MNDALKPPASRICPQRWLLLALLTVGSSAFAEAPEAPDLAAQVAAGQLPPLAQRLPQTPRLMQLDSADDREPGRYGGEMRLLMGRAKDVRMVNVYGYSRLVGYDRNYE